MRALWVFGALWILKCGLRYGGGFNAFMYGVCMHAQYCLIQGATYLLYGVTTWLDVPTCMEDCHILIDACSVRSTGSPPLP